MLTDEDLNTRSGAVRYFHTSASVLALCPDCARQDLITWCIDPQKLRDAKQQANADAQSARAAGLKSPTPEWDVADLAPDWLLQLLRERTYDS